MKTFFCLQFFLLLSSAAPNDWSSSASWPSGQVPTETDNVVITSTVYIDRDIKATSITVKSGGKLYVRDVDVKIDTNYVRVDEGGLFEWGTEQTPYTKKGILTLYGNPTDSDVVDAMGSKFVAAHGGTVKINGKVRTVSAKLINHASYGVDEILVDKCVDWVAGDQIVLLSSDIDFGQSEELTVVSADCNRVKVSRPLKFFHQGEFNQIDGYEVDERAEVILLTRNIVIQGDPTSEQTLYGAQVRAQPNTPGGPVLGVIQISGVEFFRVGQGLDANGNALLGRYPFHMHMLMEGGESCSLKNSAIHRTYSRCITIHNTHYSTIYQNIAYDYTGHCVFMEDGPEFGNKVTHNIVAGGKYYQKGLIASDGDGTDEHGTFAAYWITNPNNTYQYNTAAGAVGGYGFWIQVPWKISGPAALLPRYANLLPYDSPQPEKGFYKNIAHSYMKVIGAEEPRGAGIFMQRVGSPFVYKFVIDSYFGYKIAGAGIWQTVSDIWGGPPKKADSNAGSIVIKNSLLADNTIGMFQGGAVQNCVFIRQTLNLIKYNDSDYSRMYIPDFIVHPYTFTPWYAAFIQYDGDVIAEGNTFIDYNMVKTGAAPFYPRMDVGGVVYMNRIAFNQEGGSIFKNNKYIRSEPAGLINGGDRGGATAPRFWGNNTDINGVEMGVGFVGHPRYPYNIEGGDCRDIRQDWDLARCVNTGTFSHINIYWSTLYCSPRDQSPSMSYGDLLDRNPLKDSTFFDNHNKNGTLRYKKDWNAGCTAGNTFALEHSTMIPSQRGYHFNFNYDGLNLPGLILTVFGSRAQDSWIKISLNYPYQNAQVYDNNYNKPDKLPGIKLNSLDDFNSKTDFKLYYYHDYNTGILYIHFNTNSFSGLDRQLMISKNLPASNDIDTTNSNDVRYIDVPTRYNPPNAASGQTKYPAFSAGNAGVANPGFAAFNWGPNGPDMTKYRSYPGVIGGGSGDAGAIDHSDDDDVSAASAIFVAALSAFALLL